MSDHIVGGLVPPQSSRPRGRPPQAMPSQVHVAPRVRSARPGSARSPRTSLDGSGRASSEDVKQNLLHRVRAILAAQKAQPTPARVAAALRAEGALLGDAAVLEIVEALRREIVGFGVLEPLLALPGVTDVLVHGPEQVWIDRGHGLERTAVTFDDDAAVRRLAQRLAATADRRLDDATPFVDARLPDGTRFHAILAPVSTKGTCISLRLPRRKVYTLDELVRNGAVPRAGADLLGQVVAARLAFLVSGGTGVGKTTLLSTLLSMVPDHERLVLVEDSGELSPQHPNVVHLEARPPNVEGVGEITVRTLVRQALRMRPDRLVVGEVRGGEVVDLLSAMNTGHEGGCGTLHANSASEVPARVEALGVTAGLDRAAVHSQLAAAVDVVIHLVRARDGRRRVAELCVFERTSTGFVRALPAVTFGAQGQVSHGPGWSRLDDLLRHRGLGGLGGEPTP
ncbi:pilus assembly protein CpaF [Thermasporomyces composti]|jgi:pilus assembly protein CpaF|uniref:Pilus assembly protein CpaF n=1 Tax=Thermasporomyces composti TaxID=696763 RepID=A0A3D9V9M5_THECX|nr:pilus assembly protein CpaF [Thermasporomyces composti]